MEKNKILRINFIFILFSMSLTHSFCQNCPTWDINISTQADLDYYVEHYYNCPGFEYALVITAENIVNVDAFSNLERVAHICISNTTNLGQLDLSGFDNLVYVHQGLCIDVNPGLTHIHGFPNLVYAGSIGINANPDLQSISGFNSLESTETIFIQYNPELIDVLGFNKVKTMRDGDIRFMNLPKLTNIPNFNALEEIKGHLRIEQTGLQSIVEFNALIKVKGRIEIRDNCNLEVLNGFHKLEETKDLNIIANGLTSISNFQSLSEVSAIRFAQNLLTSIPTLERLRKVRIVQVWEMPLLQDIIGLNSIQVQNLRDVELMTNPMLSSCNTNLI